MSDDRGLAALTERLHDLTPVEQDGGVPDVCNRWPEHETQAAAILGDTGRYLPDGGLDAAWAEAEAVLPEGWWIHGIHAWSFDDMAYMVEAATAGSHYWAGKSKREKVAGTRHYAPGPNAMAYGPTPAAALRALAAKLRETTP
jgi:hypothetical protein